MNVGGPAVEITELMRSMDPSLVSQRLVTGLCGADEADFLQTQARDVPATVIEGLGRSIRPADDVAALARLVSLIRVSRPDIVHTHTAKAGVLGRVAARAAGVGARVVHTHHGHLLHGYFGPRKTSVVVDVERVLARVTDRMITVGTTVRDDLLAAGVGRADQYVIVRSGVRIASLPEPRQARAELGIAPGPVVVSMIGRLTAIKRPDRFADVVRLVRGAGDDVRFVVAGGGEQEAALAERVRAENLPVTLLGWRSDLERVLAASDVILLTSDNEGTPLSLVQAGLARIPAVATDVGSVSEVVENGVTGLLSPPDAGALADAVLRVVRDSALRLRMGAAAREKAARDFGMPAFLEGHLAVYRSVLGSAVR
jgi:glycosyltransferase involved in cell wall biosynthesis